MRRVLLGHWVAALALLWSVTVLARNNGPILHERFEIDGRPGAQPPDLAPQPASRVEGAASVPGPGALGGAPIATYSSKTSPATDTYTLDDDTSRPDVVGYDDPFSPSIPPFKRLYAYDSVDSNFQLVVRDPSLRPVPLHSQLKAGDDQFYADISIELGTQRTLRLPSVGPGARIVGAQLEPPAAFSVWQDSAENWFIQSDARGLHRLRMHLAIDRRTFGSPFKNVSWEQLRRALPALPAAVRESAGRVLHSLSISRSLAPKEALRRLVSHFRAFQPTPEGGQGTEVPRGGAALFEELTLAQKGVCRHRSFGFVPTALALGLPSRFVRNEAHAWVEVFDGSLWHRIDLGGAAGEMQLASDLEVRHTAPRDPYSWPASAGAAAELAETAVSGGSGSASGPSNSDLPNAVPTPTSASGQPSSTGAPAPSAAPVQPETVEELTDQTESTMELSEDNVIRGFAVELLGVVRHGERVCTLAPVTVFLEGGEGPRLPIGTLVTDEHGKYSGSIVIPPNMAVGDYELSVEPAAPEECK